jgi:hypothetical protein
LRGEAGTGIAKDGALSKRGDGGSRGDDDDRANMLLHEGWGQGEKSVAARGVTGEDDAGEIEVLDELLDVERESVNRHWPMPGLTVPPLVERDDPQTVLEKAGGHQPPVSPGACHGVAEDDDLTAMALVGDRQLDAVGCPDSERGHDQTVPAPVITHNPS